VQHDKISREIGDFMQRLKIKAPDIYTAARKLSGGNQAKDGGGQVAGGAVQVLVFDEPTRGIDITASVKSTRL